MALTKVSGPLLHGSNDNLGNYVINNITGAAATFSSVSVGGTLTYDDVTNVDSVGIVTARGGLHVGIGGTIIHALSEDNGKVGIGTDNLTAQLEVKGSGSSNTLNFLTKDVNRNNVFYAKDGGQVGLHYFPLVINQDTTDTDTPSGTYFYVHHSSSPFIIKNDGKVGVGTANPDSMLHLCTDDNANVTLKIQPGTTAGNYSEIVLGRTSSAPHRQTTPVVKGGVPISGVPGILFGSENTNLPAIAFQTPNSSNGHIVFKPKGSEKIRITSDGKICIAHDSVLHSGNLQVSTAGADAIDINSYSTNANSGGRLSFYRSKNASIGSTTIVADDDSLGRIDFRGYNSNGDAYDQGATIEARVDGTVDSTTDMPTAILFKTSNDGSASPDERVRINANGSIQITPEGSTGTPYMLIDTSGDSVRFNAKKSSGNNEFRFLTQSSGTLAERLRIKSDGQVRIQSDGSNDTPAKLQLHSEDTSISSGDHIGEIRFTGRDSAGAGTEAVGALIDVTAAADWNTGATGYYPSNIDFHTQSNTGTDTVAAGPRMRIAADGNVGIGTDNPLAGLVINNYGTQPVPNGNTYPYPAGNWSNVWNTTTANNTDYWVGFAGSYNISSATVNICLQPNTFNFSTQQGIYIAGEAQTTSTADFTIGKIIGGSEGGVSASAGTKRATKSELFRITSDGRVGIGITNPDSTWKTHIKSNSFGLLRLETTLTDSNAPYLELYHNSTSPADDDELGIVQFKGKNTNNDDFTYAYMMAQSTDVSDGVEDGDILFATAGNGTTIERLRIDSNGDINLGNNPTNQYGYRLNIEDSSQILYAQTASSNGTELKLFLDHGNTIANFGTVTSTHLALVTGNDERLRIDSNGDVGIGTNGYGIFDPLAPLHVCRYASTAAITDHTTLRDASTLILQTSNNVNDSRSGILFSGALHPTDGCSAGIIANHENVVENSESTSLSFYTSHNESLGERIHITSDGCVLVGKSTVPQNPGGPDNTSSGTAAEFVYGHVNVGVEIRSTNGATEQKYLGFKYGGGPTDNGGIRRDGTSNNVEFYGGSDRRIKTNIQDMDNTLSKICQMSLRKFDFKDGTGSGVGVIGQELINVFPEKVTKTDDGTGDTVPDGVEPWIVGHNYTYQILKAIQELKAENDSLKARISTLEGS